MRVDEGSIACAGLAFGPGNVARVAVRVVACGELWKVTLLYYGTTTTRVCADIKYWKELIDRFSSLPLPFSWLAASAD